MSLPGREIRVSSWLELVSHLHSPNLIQPRPEEGNHLRSPYVFRGMDVTRWELETSVQRLPRTHSTRPNVVEHSLLRSFRKYASAGTFDKQSEWYVLAVAQHNGLPTRCLDWTASPLVAAHFACGDERYKKDDGAIWCIHAGILRQINEQSNPKAASLRGIAWVYDTRLLEDRFNGLGALDSSFADGELLLLWEPPSLDLRIASQFGLLSTNCSTHAAAARARAVVMEIERSLGFEPTDREFEKLGYDIESRVAGTGRLRFIEVKGRAAGATTITVTRNEILYSLNKPEDFILAIVEFRGDGTHQAHYLRRPFQREPDFGVTSVNYDFAELLARAESPR